MYVGNCFCLQIIAEDSITVLFFKCSSDYTMQPFNLQKTHSLYLKFAVNILSAQERSSILKMAFALSNRPYFDNVY